MKASLGFPSASEEDAPPWRHWSIKGAVIIRASCQLHVSFLPLPYVSCCAPVCSWRDKSREKEREKTTLSSCDTVICYQYAAMFLMGPLVRTWHASPRLFHLIFFSKWGSRQPSITTTLLCSPETPRSTVIIWNSCSERFGSVTQNSPETPRMDWVSRGVLEETLRLYCWKDNPALPPLLNPPFTSSACSLFNMTEPR